MCLFIALTGPMQDRSGKLKLECLNVHARSKNFYAFFILKNFKDLFITSFLSCKQDTKQLLYINTLDKKPQKGAHIVSCHRQFISDIMYS